MTLPALIIAILYSSAFIFACCKIANKGTPILILFLLLGWANGDALAGTPLLVGNRQSLPAHFNLNMRGVDGDTRSCQSGSLEVARPHVRKQRQAAVPRVSRGVDGLDPVDGRDETRRYPKPVQFRSHVQSFGGKYAPTSKTPALNPIMQSSGASVGVNFYCWNPVAPEKCGRNVQEGTARKRVYVNAAKPLPIARVNRDSRKDGNSTP